MIAFTVLGVLVFWWFCFELGWALGWACDFANVVLFARRIFDAHVSVVAVAAAAIGEDDK